MKLLKEFVQIYVQELDDHRIFVKLLKDFDQDWLDTSGETLVANTSDDLWILQESGWNAAAADWGIPMEFWLEFQLILNGAISADYV